MKEKLVTIMIVSVLILSLNASLLQMNFGVNPPHSLGRRTLADPLWSFNDISKSAEICKVDEDSVEVVVGVQQESYGQLVALVENYGEIVDTVSIDGKPTAIVVDAPLSVAPYLTDEVRRSELSRYIEPNIRYQLTHIPNDPRYGEQWALPKIEADYAWNTTFGDHSVLVAIIDTGIYYNHPDIQANYVAKGRDWVNDDNDPLDDDGHGTHCAGIIAGTIDNGIGIAGVAQVQFMSEKAFGPEGGYSDDIFNAIIHAVGEGADILSNSWGGYVKSNLIYEAMRYAYDSGVLIITSAGNEGTDQAAYPGVYDECIAVSATDSTDAVVSWSNHGEYIELAAPGDSILSTFGPGTYMLMSGTSMSCPYVAGVAALCWTYLGGSKSSDWIRMWLQHTADDLGDVGHDEYYGHGRINARRSVEDSPPDHDIVIAHMDRTPYVEQGTPTNVTTKLLNFGGSTETSVVLQLIVDGSVEDSTTISSMAAGSTLAVNLSWTPSSNGVYNITSYVVPVAGETNDGNNVASKPMIVGLTTIEVPTHFTTIQEAVDTSAPGSTILVDNGTFYENIAVYKPLTLRGESSQNTTIQGAGLGMVMYIASDNVTVSGFTLKNSETDWLWSGLCFDEVSNCIASDINATANQVGVLLWECFNCSVSDSNFINNHEYGIAVQNSTGCQVFMNNATDQRAGAWLNYTSGCSIYENYFNASYYGIMLVESTGNRIVHNTFETNLISQVDMEGEYPNDWDDGYPGGGNYWIDHTSVDSYSGPNQDETGSDGILDTPYNIEGSVEDRYPLTKPYGDFTHDITMLNVTPSVTQIPSGEALNVTVKMRNLGDIAETFSITAYRNETVIEIQAVPYLRPNVNETYTFSWNTIGVSPGNYTMKAEASVVQGEILHGNNNYTDGSVKVLPSHDVAATTITPSRNIVGQGYDNVTISVDVLNKGTYSETFNVTLYADVDLGTIGDEITIGEQEVTSLMNASTQTLTFKWNTTSAAMGLYTFTATAEVVAGETYVSDNNATSGDVLITIPGDVNGDHKCDMVDIFALILAFGSESGQPSYNADHDINIDGKIDMLDIFLAILAFGEEW